MFIPKCAFSPFSSDKSQEDVVRSQVILNDSPYFDEGIEGLEDDSYLILLDE